MVANAAVTWRFASTITFERRLPQRNISVFTPSCIVITALDVNPMRPVAPRKFA